MTGILKSHQSMKLALAAPALLLIMLVVLLSAPGKGAAVSVYDPPTPGSLSGHVTDENGQPLAGIVVKAFVNMGRFDYSDYVWQSFHTAVTDQNGNYTLTDLEPVQGPYPPAANPPGFPSQPAYGYYRISFDTPTGRYLKEYYNNQTIFDNAALVTIAPGQVVTGIDAILTALQACSGASPDLRLTQGRPFWASYAMYMSRVVNVPFAVTNNGPSSAFNLRTIGVENTHGVRASSIGPWVGGTVPPGGSSSSEITFFVSNTASFRANLYATAQDEPLSCYYFFPS